MTLYGHQYTPRSISNDSLGGGNLPLNIKKIEIWLRYKLDFVLDKNHLKINYMYMYMHNSMSMQLKCMLQKYPGLISTVSSMATLLIIKYQSMYLDMFFWIAVICKQCKKMTIKDMRWKLKKKIYNCILNTNFYSHARNFFLQSFWEPQWRPVLAVWMYK